MLHKFAHSPRDMLWSIPGLLSYRLGWPGNRDGYQPFLVHHAVVLYSSPTSHSDTPIAERGRLWSAKTCQLQCDQTLLLPVSLGIARLNSLCSFCSAVVQLNYPELISIYSSYSPFSSTVQWLEKVTAVAGSLGLVSQTLLAENLGNTSQRSLGSHALYTKCRLINNYLKQASGLGSQTCHSHTHSHACKLRTRLDHLAHDVTYKQ